jgi:hypothetical protein
MRIGELCSRSKYLTAVSGRFGRVADQLTFTANGGRLITAGGAGGNAEANLVPAGHVCVGASADACSYNGAEYLYHLTFFTLPAYEYAALTAKQPVKLSNSAFVGRVCSQEACYALANLSCGKPLADCSHTCGGVCGESVCLPCLEPECVSKSKQLLLTSEDTCAICGDGLRRLPSVAFGCRHALHYSCLMARLEFGWPTARIDFGFLACPLCKQDITPLDPQQGFGHVDADVRSVSHVHPPSSASRLLQRSAILSALPVF